MVEIATPSPLDNRSAPIEADGLAILTAGDLALSTLRDAWDRLAQRASTPNPFLESWALLPGIDCFAEGGRVSIACYWQGGELCGLLPVARASSYAGYPLPHIATWSHPNAFCCLPLVAEGHEQGFWHALLSWADKNAGGGLFFHLPLLALETPAIDALRVVLGGRGRAAGVVASHERALLASDLPPEAYFDESLSGKKRKELRRQARRLGEMGAVSFVRCTDDEGLAEWIAGFLDLERRGWKGEEGSALDCAAATRDFFTRALAGAAEAGRLERLTLSLDGKPLAMLANFITPPGCYSFKTAYDEDFARFSPGVLLQRENLDLLARPDVEWADSCAAADHPMIERIWREKRRMVSVNVAIGGTLRRSLFRQLLERESHGTIEEL